MYSTIAILTVVFMNNYKYLDTSHVIVTNRTIDVT